MTITQIFSRTRGGLVVAACAVACAFTVASALAQTVAVVVNGQTVQFDQPPVERSGRVFVPLRGVFERLGASVVYDNGVINATGNGRTVQLRIGSTQATVDGQPQTIDVAPFLIGSRTLVPIRFISQSLGANVDWNNGTNTVTISSGGAGAQAVTLANLTPSSGAVVAAKSPAVSGTFSSSVDPNSVHITLDGRDVSSTTDISPTNFLFTPPYPLTPQSHTVRVTGKGTNGLGFDQSWSFTSGTSVTGNYINSVQPTNGNKVSSSFTLSGSTLPNSSVHIVAVPTQLVGGIFPVTSGTYVADLKADASGHFSQTVSVNTTPGGNVAVRVTSVAPTSLASKTLNLSYSS
ncbi:MAG: copper amine oxidase N-terminal domain-containing protein [Candidatus Eremiobacteraeota bacterium]|nr:copper amine oxidase N-terminal domain-containing protein [Candidatus Eremiobacteraeota bacterium]